MADTDDGGPAKYSHDIRHDVDELRDEHGLRETGPGGGRVLEGEELLVETSDVRLNAETGGVVALVRVETPRVQAVVHARAIDVFGLGFEVVGTADGERLQLLPGECA